MALLPETSATFDSLVKLAATFTAADDLNSAYYEGSQRLEHIGLAVPPELRRFETVVNWNRVAVDSIEQRLKVKSFILPDETEAATVLREHWDANNLDSESALLHKDTLIYGRGFVCVGTNPDDAEHPLITVESPRELTVSVDPRTRRVSSALRLYGGSVESPNPTLATLYLPNETIWFEKDKSGWVETDRDPHNLGRVPIVMFLNRRRTGLWTGVSEMKDVIPLVDSAARALTSLQLALETVAAPKRAVLGASKGDFVDSAGKPLPVWEAYLGALWATGNKDAKVVQLDGADLSNFHNTIDHYAKLVASVTGLPTRYLGQTSVNPAAEGAIRADESRLVLNVEGKASNFGDGWAWVQGIAERFRTGSWLAANRIKTEFFDAGTPTFAQKSDALTKLHGGGPILSREGTWDELGWSEARKDKERAYFEAEAHDPLLEKLVAAQDQSTQDL